MDQHSNNILFRRFDLVEFPFCLSLNRICRHLLVKATFVTISRLGNGVFWYSLLTLILVTRGTDAISPVLQITLRGLTGVLIYKLSRKGWQGNALISPFMALNAAHYHWTVKVSHQDIHCMQYHSALC